MLSCKGCKGDCPVRVDVATYKAEFLAHYYKGRLRPKTAYSMGLIYWWARLASRIPGFANFFAQSKIMKSLAGISANRKVPKFAKRTFRESFAKKESGGKSVILWPDTFNNFFFPHTLNAAAEVLQNAGFAVRIPERILCCGRPLYDYGMLTTAKKLLTQILENLKNEIRQGIPIVGIEPSCVAVFRDELPNLFPDNEDAIRLSRQTYLLSEFLLKNDVEIPALHKKAIVHMHCHHRAVMGVQNEERILQKMGLDYQILDSGCCGMAGSFGSDQDHYENIRDIAKLALVPGIQTQR